MTMRQRGGHKGEVVDTSKEKVGNKKTPKRLPKLQSKFNPKLRSKGILSGADDTWLSHRTWAKLVSLGSVLMVAYLSSSSSFISSSSLRACMAKQSESLSEKRSQNVLCAPAYKRDIQQLGNPGCVPNRCGRVVMDNVIDESDVYKLLDLAKRGLAKGGSEGGASILDLHSGALSKGRGFVDVYREFPHLFTEADFVLYKRVREQVQRVVCEHFTLDCDVVYLTHPTFFSRITSREAKTVHDEYWHVHVDKETYPSFHITSLLYLTDANIDFQGGHFVFVDNHDNLNRTVEPRLGRISAFTSGAENRHHVDPVTQGTRYALTFGFTCDQSKAIKDPGPTND